MADFHLWFESFWQRLAVYPESNCAKPYQPLSSYKAILPPEDCLKMAIWKKSRSINLRWEAAKLYVAEFLPSDFYEDILIDKIVLDNQI